MGFNPAPFTSAYDISLNKFRKYYAIITKVFQTALVAIFCNTLAWGQPVAGLRVSFWNVENLFDMENDLEKNDQPISTRPISRFRNVKKVKK